jgi:rhodanese-related sulfurtransferase
VQHIRPAVAVDLGWLQPISVNGGKKMFRKALLCLMALLFTATGAFAFLSGGYNYISAADLQKRLEANSPMILVDICSVEQFAKGHIPGSLETNAYPVETDEQRAALAGLLPQILESSDDVIVLCPRGGGGAKKTYDFYKNNGVAESRLLILEKGVEKWPYATQAK